MNYRLEDVEARFESGKFESRPTIEVLTALKPGQFAKLIFLNEPGMELTAERLWVEVERVTEAGFVGTLRNNPAVIHGLDWGDEVHFEARHISDVVDEF